MNKKNIELIDQIKTIAKSLEDTKIDLAINVARSFRESASQLERRLGQEAEAFIRAKLGIPGNMPLKYTDIAESLDSPPKGVLELATKLARELRGSSATEPTIICTHSHTGDPGLKYSSTLTTTFRCSNGVTVTIQRNVGPT